MKTIQAMAAWLLLHNPASKNGLRAARRAREIIGARGLDSHVSLRWVPLAELAGESDLPERLLVLGGDGSINAAAEWLATNGASCPLAVLPAGTGNNLARGLGIPLDLEAALDLAFRGRELQPLDAVSYVAGGGSRPRLMVQTAALGFPAEIASAYDRLRRHSLFRHVCRPAGPFVYRFLAFLGLAAQKRKERRGDPMLEVECSLPGEHLRERVFAIFIGNEKSLGGNFHPCPLARVDDGAVDLCLIRAGTGAAYLDLFRSVIRGEHLALERDVVYRQTRGPLELELSRPCWLLADGDLWVEDRRFRLEVLPRRFQVVVS